VDTTVEVSLVTVDSSEVRLPVKEGEPVAILTVQMAHTPLKSAEHVNLEVGTFRTDPAGRVSADYDPFTQEIALTPAPQGVVTAEVKILRPQLRGGSKGTLVVTATLTHPSSGIRIVNNDPGASNHIVTITITGK
jgi:hypothetical protein